MLKDDEGDGRLDEIAAAVTLFGGLLALVVGGVYLFYTGQVTVDSTITVSGNVPAGQLITAAFVLAYIEIYGTKHIGKLLKNYKP